MENANGFTNSALYGSSVDIIVVHELMPAPSGACRDPEQVKIQQKLVEPLLPGRRPSSPERQRGRHGRNSGFGERLKVTGNV